MFHRRDFHNAGFARSKQGTALPPRHQCRSVRAEVQMTKITSTKAGDVIDPDYVTPGPTLAEQQAAMKEAMRQAVAAHVEATAQSRDYDSAVSLASYVADPNPAWAAEAQAFVAWRSAVWGYVFTRLAAVQAGQESPPESGAALVADLPVIEWPA